MTTAEPGKNWKLDLRYGRLKTPFRHYTAIGEGVVGALEDGFACPEGPAFMGMKMWASSSDEAIDMLGAIGRQIGFTLKGRVYVYDTEPIEPPKAGPFGYDISFTPFSEGSPSAEGESGHSDA